MPHDPFDVILGETPAPAPAPVPAPRAAADPFDALLAPDAPVQHAPWWSEVTTPMQRGALGVGQLFANAPALAEQVSRSALGMGEPEPGDLSFINARQAIIDKRQEKQDIQDSYTPRTGAAALPRRFGEAAPYVLNLPAAVAGSVQDIAQTSHDRGDPWYSTALQAGAGGLAQAAAPGLVTAASKIPGVPQLLGKAGATAVRAMTKMGVPAEAAAGVVTNAAATVHSAGVGPVLTAEQKLRETLAGHPEAAPSWGDVFKSSIPFGVLGSVGHGMGALAEARRTALLEAAQEVPVDPRYGATVADPTQANLPLPDLPPKEVTPLTLAAPRAALGRDPAVELERVQSEETPPLDPTAQDGLTHEDLRAQAANAQTVRPAPPEAQEAPGRQMLPDSAPLEEQLAQKTLREQELAQQLRQQRAEDDQAALEEAKTAADAQAQAQTEQQAPLAFEQSLDEAKNDPLQAKLTEARQRLAGVSREAEAFPLGQRPILSAIQDLGGVQSRAQAEAQGIKPGGEYDDLKLPTAAAGRAAPDVMADTLHRSGLIHEPTVKAMVKALRDETVLQKKAIQHAKAVRAAHAEVRALEAQAKRVGVIRPEPKAVPGDVAPLRSPKEALAEVPDVIPKVSTPAEDAATIPGVRRGPTATEIADMTPEARKAHVASLSEQEKARVIPEVGAVVRQRAATRPVEDPGLAKARLAAEERQRRLAEEETPAIEGEPAHITAARQRVADFEAGRKSVESKTPSTAPTQAKPLDDSGRAETQNRQAGQESSGASPEDGTTSSARAQPLTMDRFRSQLADAYSRTALPPERQGQVVDAAVSLMHASAKAAGESPDDFVGRRLMRVEGQRRTTEPSLNQRKPATEADTLGQGEEPVVVERKLTGNLHERRKAAIEDGKRVAKGGPYENPELGPVRVSIESIHKALSGSSMAKSDRNTDHLEAVRALPDMIRRAVVTERHADRDKNPNISQIIRLSVPLRVGDATYQAKLTVKALRDEPGSNFYSYELMKMEMPGAMREGHADHSTAEPSRPTGTSAGNSANPEGPGKPRPDTLEQGKRDQMNLSHNGNITFIKDGRALIRILQSGNESTILHEMGHLFRRYLKADDLGVAERALGVTGGVWKRGHEERFARSFERWLAKGESPTEPMAGVFAKFKQWLTDVYHGITGSDIDVKVSPALERVFKNILTEGRGLQEDYRASGREGDAPKESIPATKPTQAPPESGPGSDRLENSRAGRESPGASPEDGTISKTDEATTGIANEVSAADRERLGLPARETPEGRTFDEMYDTGKAAAAQDPLAVMKLLDQMRANPEKIISSDAEAGLLLKHKVDLENNLQRLVAQSKQAEVDGDANGQLIANTELASHRQAAKEFTELVERAGTAAGRALVSRKMMSNMDYSLSHMEATAEDAKGAPLTPKELARIDQLHQELMQKTSAAEKAQAAYKTRLGQKIDTFNAKIEDRDFTKEPKKKRPAYDAETLRLQAELESVKRRWNAEVRVLERSKMSKAAKVGGVIAAAPGFFKSLKASLDDSAVFRQGWRVMFTNPIIWQRNALKTLTDAAKTIGGKEVMDAVHAEIKLNPYYEQAKQAKLAVATTEEDFPTSLPGRVPLLGRVYKASENAYTAFQYRNRMDVFSKMMDIAKKSGVDITDQAQLRSIGKLVNSLTGRGNLGMFEPAAGIVNNVFFSGRKIKADFDFLTMHLTDTSMTGFARKQAVMNLAKAVAGTATVLLIAKAMDDNSVEFDPRSADFGKIRSGNTRFEVTGGVSPMLTLAARIASWASKSSTTGEINPLNSGDFGSQTAAGAIGEFFANKLSPTASVALNTLRGGRHGQPQTLAKDVEDLLLPMAIGNFISLQNDTDATPGSIAAGVAADFVGVGVGNYGGNN